MRLMVGLGNPGPTYTLTRHNAGVRFVEALADRLVSPYGWRKHKGIRVFESKEWILVKSEDVFMNESGRMLEEFMGKIKDKKLELWVAHDDLDIRLGEYKIQKGKGPKVHGGVNSIEQRVGSKGFYRVRLGIDNRVLAIKGEEYVLQRFSLEENEVVKKMIEEAVGDVSEKVWEK